MTVKVKCLGLIFALLGIVDIIGAFTLLLPDFLGGLAVTLGTIILVKGVWSALSSLLSGYFFIWMDIVDITIGATLLFSLSLPGWIFWSAIVLMFFKAVRSLIGI